MTSCEFEMKVHFEQENQSFTEHITYPRDAYTPAILNEHDYEARRLAKNDMLNEEYDALKYGTADYFVKYNELVQKHLEFIHEEKGEPLRLFNGATGEEIFLPKIDEQFELKPVQSMSIKFESGEVRSQEEEQA